jgi:hypothetical protein
VKAVNIRKTDKEITADGQCVAGVPQYNDGNVKRRNDDGDEYWEN